MLLDKLLRDTSSGWSLNVANRHCQFIVVVLTLHTLQSFAVQRRIGSRWGLNACSQCGRVFSWYSKIIDKTKTMSRLWDYVTSLKMPGVLVDFLKVWSTVRRGPAKQSEKERSDRTLQSDAVSGNLLRTRLEPEFRLFKSTRLNGYSCRGCLSLAVLSPSFNCD